MKSIRKDVVIDHQQLDNLKLEKQILLSVNHPFLVSMEFVFQKDLRVYFLMDYVSGGELYKVMQTAKRLPEAHAKFYAAQIALALGYLHESKIIYRDLKPENIMIENDGYLKLGDFGMAKMMVDEPANSFCGTPEYLCKSIILSLSAPEMIQGTGHDHTVDWWAFGVLM